MLSTDDPSASSSSRSTGTFVSMVSTRCRITVYDVLHLAIRNYGGIDNRWSSVSHLSLWSPFTLPVVLVCPCVVKGFAALGWEKVRDLVGYRVEALERSQEIGNIVVLFVRRIGQAGRRRLHDRVDHLEVARYDWIDGCEELAFARSRGIGNLFNTCVCRLHADWELQNIGMHIVNSIIVVAADETNLSIELTVVTSVSNPSSHNIAWH
jgi:hypothetical protein